MDHFKGSGFLVKKTVKNNTVIISFKNFNFKFVVVVNFTSNIKFRIH